MAKLLDCMADRIFDYRPCFRNTRRSYKTAKAHPVDLPGNFVRFEWTAFADRGTPYHVRESELRTLQSPRFIPRDEDAYYLLDKRLSKAEAYDFLISHLPPNTLLNLNQRRAYARLHEAWELSTAETGPDLYIKIFNDLDSVLFGGKVYKRVYLSWTDSLPSDCAGRCSPPGDGVPRVRVQLVWRLIAKGDKAFVWGTVVHEMLHAFFMIIGDECDDRYPCDDEHGDFAWLRIDWPVCFSLEGSMVETSLHSVFGLG